VVAGEVERDEASVVDELGSMIADTAVRPAAIAALLDGLAADLRPRVVRRLGPAAQRALYARVEGFLPLHLIDLVPARAADLEEVRHLGRNTLPAFRIFEKRFCRPPGQTPEEPESLAGYNFQTMSRVTGPGYFVARDDGDRGEVLVDYAELPTVRPTAWPEIRSNERGLARFVYGFMVDRLRRVSEHVTIGCAARNGRELGSYFVLSRAD
jgi:hypothetical protein